jgi:uncharacterized protein YndB with AHSA1/START domain
MVIEASVVDSGRQLNAAPEMVFGTFADPQLVSRWLKPSPDVRLDVLAFDFRPGGAFRFAYHMAGGQIMHVNGVFRAIDTPSRLVFSWNIEPPDEHAGVESEVHVSIAPHEAGCELHIRHINLSRPGAPERHAQDWKGALDNLAILLSKGKQG